MVRALLKDPPAYAIPASLQRVASRGTLVVADTGATQHMLPDKRAFISYRPVSDLRVRMGNTSFASVRGVGTAIIALNGKQVLMREALHIPDLRHPLYSLRAHHNQRGCGFIGGFGQGVYVCFPTFVLDVDTTHDCYMEYRAIGRAAGLADLDYVQPKPRRKGSDKADLVAATASPEATALPEASPEGSPAPSLAPHSVTQDEPSEDVATGTHNAPFGCWHT